MATTIRQDEFFDAIARGDMAMVNEVLQDRPGAADWGMEVNAGMKLAGGGLRMPLHHAALFGQTEVARALVEAGAPLDARDKGCCTALLMAVQDKHDDMALMLIDAGADPNIPGGIDDTPLMFAAGRGACALAEKLIASGADLNAVSSIGCSALHWAVEKEDRRMVALLIRHGIDTEIRNDAGQTAAGQNSNLAAYIAGCTERRREQQEFVQNQIDMVKHGSHAAVTVRKPLVIKRPMP